MKTTIVPAQITTVEDKIIGNLTFIQIVFLIIPLLSATAIYALVPPRIHLGGIKLTLMILQFAVFVPLMIRIKSKTIADWLVIVLRFRFRPRLYLFTKNDLTTRKIAKVELVPKKNTKKAEKTTQKEELNKLTFAEAEKIKELSQNTLSIKFDMGKKGGINVSVGKTK